MKADVLTRWRGAALLLIVAAAGLRVLYLGSYCPLDLAPDEAHYWDWSRQLDWCYYSKGPLTAWLIRLSCELLGPLSQSLTGSEVLAVRLPAVGCGSLLLAGLYVLTVQVYRNDRLGFMVVAFALTLPIVAAGSSLMTIDSPFACAWMWALVFAYRAVFRQERWAWPVAGICLLLGFLAKHTMVLWIPSLALFLATTPTLRAQLCQRGFWIMTGVGSLGAMPIVAWNAMNGWVTLRHTQSHVGLETETFVHWLGPLWYLGGQFGILLGFWFVVWARSAWRHRPTCETDPTRRYLWWMSVPTFLFFGLFSFKNGGGEANWPLAGYLSGMVLAAGWMVYELDHSSAWYRQLYKNGAIAWGTLGLLLTLLFHEPIFWQPVLLRLTGTASEQRPMPIRRVDPTSRLRGWRFLAAEVDRTRAELKTRGIEPVLAAERWTLTAELAFYCHERPRVYCLGVPLGDRDSQYDLWRPNPVTDSAMFRGRSFVLVGLDLHRLRPRFDSFEPTRKAQYRENDLLVAEWNIVLAHGFRGWGNLDEVKLD